MQGEVYGPLCCSVQVDTFGKECIQQRKYLYQYKEIVGIPPLAMVDDLVLISNCGLESVMMNGFINCKTNIKKLQFGVEKCHKMHVGRKNQICPDLFIDGWELKPVDSIESGNNTDDIMMDTFSGSCGVDDSKSEKYLGDIIRQDGKNKSNIEARRGKGFGTVNQTMNMINDICFGPFTFEVALVMRDSFLINSILTNSEAWIELSSSEIDSLEQVDESLLRRLLEAGQGCPKEMLYLEMGCTPIRFTIMMRRIMFLHYILNEDKNALVNQVLQAQINEPSRNDFIFGVENALEELEIFLSLDDIKNFPKETLRKFVQIQVNEKALIYLNKQKLKHTKVMDIQHTELSMENYLLPKNIKSLELARFLFSARTRMIDVGANYGKTVQCKLGCEELDTQQHLLNCPKLEENDVIATGKTYEYEDLFSSQVEEELVIASVLSQKFKRRKDILKAGKR